MSKSKRPQEIADRTEDAKKLTLRRSENARTRHGDHEPHRRLREITDHVNSCVAHIDLDQRYTYVNKRYADLVGQETRDILGKSVEAVLSQSAYEMIEPKLTSAFKGEPQHFVTSLTLGSGQIGRFDIAYVPDVSHEDRIAGLHILVTDITEGWKAQQNLKINNELLTAVINGTSDPIFAKDLNGLYLMWNEACVSVLKVSTEEVIGRSNIDLFPPELAKIFDEEDSEVIQTGKEKSYHNEVIVDGELRHFQTIKTPIFGETGEVKGLVGIARDITERIRAEESLRKTTAYLDSILNNIPAGVAILEAPDFRYLRINKTLADINGLSIDDHLGKTIDEILPEASKYITPRLEAAIKSGQATPYHEFSATFPGTPDDVRWMMDSFFPIISNDGIAGAVGVLVMDITDRKKAEEDLVTAKEQIETAHMATTEKNVALKELMLQAGNERRWILEQINSNVERILFPILSKLESKSDSSSRQYVTLLKSSLREITSSFVGNISRQAPSLSPRELEITNMVREGMSSKEIASALDTAEATVRKQRKTIRKKLGIANQPVNLRSFLQNSTYRPN